MKIPLFSIFFILSVWCSTAFSQTCDRLVITGPPYAPPSSWIENNQLIGASVEFVKNIALAAGVKSVIVQPYDSWDEALKAAQNGQVDILFSAAFSQQRSRYLNFIQPPYAGQFLYAIVEKGKEFPLRKYDDLKGRKGIAGIGETYGNSKFGSFVESQLSIERSPSITQSFDLLLEGKVDYILAYENTANSEIFKRNIGDKLSILSTYPFFAETFIAMSRRSKCAGNFELLLSKQIEIAKTNNLYYSLTSKFRNAFISSHTAPN